MTVDGFVFRVDMRLRPYGSAGALVLSFNALEQCYQDQGRDWERYAMIKSRVVAGDQMRRRATARAAAPLRVPTLSGFLRHRSAAHHEAADPAGSAAQGHGRRTSSWAPVASGKWSSSPRRSSSSTVAATFSLQQRPLLKVLSTLEGQGYLPPAVIASCVKATNFLRYAEHAIQAIADRQTQMLPGWRSGSGAHCLYAGFAELGSSMSS